VYEYDHVKCVPVITTCRALALKIEEWPPVVEGSCEFVE
jgi:hypothetical protein